MAGLTPQYLPSINSTGYYKLAAPYSALISRTTQYTCQGTSTISGLIAQGVDVLNAIYLATGDTKANYLKDLANNISIVTISSGIGSVIKFPSSAMLAIPQTNGIIYRNTVLGIALSATPDYLDLSTLQTEISDMVYNHLGIKSTTFLTTIGSPTVLTVDQDNAVKSARQAAITNPASTYHANQLLMQENAALRARLAQLEEYIVANIPPNNNVP